MISFAHACRIGAHLSQVVAPRILVGQTLLLANALDIVGNRVLVDFRWQPTARPTGVLVNGRPAATATPETVEFWLLLERRRQTVEIMPAFVFSSNAQNRWNPTVKIELRIFPTARLSPSTICPCRFHRSWGFPYNIRGILYRKRRPGGPFKGSKFCRALPALNHTTSECKFDTEMAFALFLVGLLALDGA